MLKTPFLFFMILFLLAGCASPAGPTALPSESAANTSTIPPNTNTPLADTPSPTPDPTAAPIPTDFNTQNFSQFTAVQSYGSMLGSYFNQETYNLPTYAMDYSADGSTIAISGCVYACAADLGGRVFIVLLDPQMKQPLLELPAEGLKQIWDIDLAPDGSFLFVSMRGKVLRYDLSTLQAEQIFTPADGTEAPFTGISPDGKTLAIVTKTQLLVLNLADGSEVAKISGQFYGLNSPFFNAQGNRFVVYTQQTDRDAVVFDTTTWTETARFPIPGTGAAAISSDGNLLAALSPTETAVKIYNLSAGTNQEVTVLPYAIVASLTFNPADDLLLTFGEPVDNEDFFEGVQVIDLQSGEVTGSLTQDSNPARIKFSADGTSFLRFNTSATDIALWSLPAPENLQVAALIEDYFSAIDNQDYQSAADMSALDEYAIEELTLKGLSADDLPAAFEALCAEDEVPCLPLGRLVRVMADFDRGWDYYALVTLQNPDGSEVLFDDISRYALVGVTIQPDDSYKISTLHPGMSFPYE